ncbi:MAG: hypothetical protein GY821_06450 [Gammaproteobacteria bacterium]|nr:hypothetical protein [Gammaproteobacteria bacterium]
MTSENNVKTAQVKHKSATKQRAVTKSSTGKDEVLQIAAEDIKCQSVVAWPTAGAIFNNNYSENERIETMTNIEKKITGMVTAMEPRDTHETILMQNMVTAQEWQSKLFLKASRLMDTTHMPTLDYVAKLIKISANFMNLYTKQIETLDKHRQMQRNTVPSRVEVNDGGQAIVGDVTIHSSGEKEK